MTLKTLRFDYFETWVRKIDKNSNSATDRRLDISNLLDKALRIQRQDTLRDFRSEKARIQKIELRSDGCYEIEFLRLRESMPPGIANDSGNYEIIRLGNDEYIGEFTAALYDPAKSILIIHRNFRAFTPSGIQDYLNSVVNDGDTEIILIPVVEKDVVERILKSKYFRSISISLSTNNELIKNESGSLNEIIQSATLVGAKNISVDMSVGTSKKGASLEHAKVTKIIKRMMGYNDLRKFKVKHKENEDSRVEEIDLLDERIHDRCSIDASREKPLDYDSVISKLVELYRLRNGE